MKYLVLSVVAALAACTGVRHMAVDSGEAAQATEACSDGPCPSGPCQAELRCLPNGNCEIQCTSPSGETCTVEVERPDDC
jgi:hypothetical protein